MKHIHSTRRTSLLAGLTLAGLGTAGCGALESGPPLETVPLVDVERYMGRWYEIAKYPNAFEVGCTGVTAEYTLQDDGTVKVLNTCRTADGAIDGRTIEGFATVADAQTNAKLTVYFFYPFGAPYWIIDLDDDYAYAVVGDPTRRFLWILSRTPTLADETLNPILARIAEQGYDPARLEYMTQFPEANP